ncbi:hypothetical protein C4J81_15250 [Deltaproteobacteria bacterium Smac51]|nr:hypothetical protein C4J81_15250 [Deltaproteobacteria bacterium Smac51]
MSNKNKHNHNKDGIEVCVTIESETMDFIAESEKDLAGERADMIERAEDVADGTVMPVAPGDDERTPRAVAEEPLDDGEETVREVNFNDGTSPRDHGRGLV